MKESISMTTILQIVILFILLFTGIMALTINNSNAFGVKDSLVSVIEQYDGNYIDKTENKLSSQMISVLEQATYRTTGKCDDGWEGYDRTGKHVDSGDKASVCIRSISVTEGLDDYYSKKIGSQYVATGDFINGVYYQVKVFYQLDIPIINQVFNFSTKGETKIIYGD